MKTNFQGTGVIDVICSKCGEFIYAGQQRLTFVTCYKCSLIDPSKENAPIVEEAKPMNVVEQVLTIVNAVKKRVSGRKLLTLNKPEKGN